MKMAANGRVRISTTYRLGRRLARRVKGAFLAVAKCIGRWQRLAYERRLLAAMDDHQLKDIGISRAEAAQESARPFWDDADTQSAQCDRRDREEFERDGCHVVKDAPEGVM